jgi:hypothetical protein
MRYRCEKIKEEHLINLSGAFFVLYKNLFVVGVVGVRITDLLESAGDVGVGKLV